MSSDNKIVENACPSHYELSAFSDGQLADAQLVAISDHVATCRQCETIVATMLRGDDAVVAAVAAVHKWEPMFSDPAFRDLRALGQAMALPFDHFSIDVAARGTDADGRHATDFPKPTEHSKTRTWHDTGHTPENPKELLPEKIGEYFVLRQIGSGGFGNVYLAKDPQHTRLVAIKVPQQYKFSEDFLKEARTLATLDHPNVLPVHDWVRTPNGGCFVVMQYVDGQSLDVAMKREKFCHVRIAEICAQITTALHYAHGQGFVHRDVKPANILLDRNGRCYICDFGLAIHDSNQQRHKNDYAGTRPYMSPEHVRGESDQLDGRSDVWAMGTVLYELLTGRRPFDGDPIQLRNDILHRPPKPLRQIDDSIPAELERICLRCLNKDVSNRYATALDLAQDLREWMLSASPAMQPANARASSVQRDNRLAAVCMAFAVVSAGLAMYWYYHSDARGDPSVVHATGGPVATVDRYGEWFPLLEQPLDTIVALKGDDTDFSQQDTDKHSLTLRSERNLWILATRHRSRPPLRVRGSVYMDEWMGGVGFIWGLPNDPLAFPRRKLQCFAILIERYDPDELLTLSLKQLFIDDFIQDVPWVNHATILAQTTLDTPLKQFQSLDVVVNETGVEVRIDRRVVWRPEVRDPNVLQEVLSADGSIGVVGRGKTVVFREATGMFQDPKNGER